MPALIDIKGQRFTRLTVIDRISNVWLCVCDCGQERRLQTSVLLTGNTKSCGCLQKEVKSARHGMSESRTYHSWKSMIARCTNSRTPVFYRYGGRGISVCTSWTIFDGFFRDMGVRPDGMSLDRINNDGNYEPSNCRWATRTEQASNRRTNLLVTYQGETLCVSEWARRLGIGKTTLKFRIRAGWPIEQALTQPTRTSRRK